MSSTPTTPASPSLVASRKKQNRISTTKKPTSGTNSKRSSAALTAALRATQLAPTYAFTYGASTGRNSANDGSGLDVRIPTAALPAEIMEMVFEHTDVATLVCGLGATSRRMKEMVSEEGIWVKRLVGMKCWDAAAARQAEIERERRLKEQRRATQDGSLNKIGVVFDAETHESPKVKNPEQADWDEAGIVSTGQQFTKTEYSGDIRSIMSGVQSIRGRAMKEYGKVHGTLWPFYKDITSSGTLPGSGRIFTDFPLPEDQAVILAQLNRFCAADWASGKESREAHLRTNIIAFEAAAIREFDAALSTHNVGGSMKKYARILHTLNGGAVAVDAWIEANTVIRMAKSGTFGTPHDCIANAFTGTIVLGPAEEFFGRLREEVNSQLEESLIVFPSSMDVFTVFVERIIERIIGKYVCDLVDEALEQSIESYLKAIAGTFQLSLKFLDELIPVEERKIQFRSVVLRDIIKCFDGHMEKYLEDELQWFRTRAENEVHSWGQRLQEEEQTSESFYMSNVSRQAAKQDFLSTFKKTLLLPVTVITSIPTSFAPKKHNIAQLQSENSEYRRPATPVLDRNGTPIPPEQAPTTELAAKAAIMTTRLEGIKGLFSIQVAISLVQTAKACLERMIIFVPILNAERHRVKEQCEAIFVSLLQILGYQHVKTGFDKAVNHLSNYKPREIHGNSSRERGEVAPLMTFLELVNVGDLIQQMLDVFYTQELVAVKLSDRDDFLSPAVKEKKRFEQMLDERVAAGLNKGIDVLMDEVEYICSTVQNSEDYKPSAGPDGQVRIQDIGPTKTAKQVVEVVEGHVGMLVGSTDKSVLDVFLQEVGLRLFSVLCKHIKRQRISVEGAIVLISDVTHYHNYVKTFKQKALMEYFTVLRELTQIYLVSPDDAKEIGVILADSDRYRGILTPEEVFEFAERRADWFLVKRDVEKALYGQCTVM